MHIVTGGAGFIGSCVIAALNKAGIDNILVVDSLKHSTKYKNLMGLDFSDYMEKEAFIEQVEGGGFDVPVSAIIHMGACSATTELDASYLMKNNFNYSKSLALMALHKNARYIYASSAATYGDGSRGYSDRADLLSLRPLNPYGYSKSLFDQWAQKHGLLDKAVGLKFFNVYGPREDHKEEMRSVVNKAFEQINRDGQVKLFKSHHPDYKDGEQLRDFVYVKDAVDMILFFLENRQIGGLFNVGTGEARSFKDLVTATFKAMGKEPNIEFIDMPVDLRPRYQYYTRAEMEKAKEVGYQKPMTSLEEGIADYVQNWLMVKDSI